MISNCKTLYFEPSAAGVIVRRTLLLIACCTVLAACESRTQTLAELSAGCSVTDVAGNPVRFAQTPVPKDVKINSNQSCALARQVAEEARRAVQSVISGLCAPAEKLVRDFKKGSYAETKRYLLSARGFEREQVRVAVRALDMCETEESRKRAARETSDEMGHSVYSVGAVVDAGRTCLGYLEEVTSASRGGSVGYTLRGSGTCAGLRYDSKEHFHPKANPNGPRPGDFFRSRFQYSGPLPREWRYEGSTFPFASPSTDTVRPHGVASEPIKSGIPALRAPEPQLKPARLNIKARGGSPRYKTTVALPQITQFGGLLPLDVIDRYPALRTEIERLLGPSYSDFRANLVIQTPMHRWTEDALIGSGCALELCGTEEASLYVNSSGAVAVALMTRGPDQRDEAQREGRTPKIFYISNNGDDSGAYMSSRMEEVYSEDPTIVLVVSSPIPR